MSCINCIMIYNELLYFLEKKLNNIKKMSIFAI